MGLTWYWHRLRAMSTAEMLHRAGEHWKHRSDASFASRLEPAELDDTAEILPLPDPAAAPEVLKQALASDAAALRRGDWKLYGWCDVKAGVPPRWHRDLMRGVDVASDGLSHALNHRALPDGADARTVWEINRWSEMTRLAMHGWLNDDPDAVQVAMAWLDDWCDQNPVGRGINWASPLEAGLRLMNFAWFDAIAARMEDDRLAKARRKLAGRIVPAHAAWIWRYRSFGSSANNHLLGELTGLLHAICRWPALERTICPAAELWQGIERCVLEQFAEDGGNREQALHYHLFAWEMAWHAARIMKITKGPAVNRLKMAAAFFAQVAHDSEQWEQGDNDDAQIIPLTLNRERAVAEWRSWMRGAGEAGQSLRYWLGDCHVDVAEGWWLAKETGLAVAERDGWKVRLDASPLGFGSMAAHGHADALHVSIWDGAEALVIDPGTGGYFAAKDLRTELAGWAAHNGPQSLEGFQTPRRMGTFLWMQHHAPPLLDGNENGVRARFRHEGREWVRRVSFPQDGGLEIMDETSDGAAMKTRWFFAPECEVRIISGGLAISRGARCWTARFSSSDTGAPVRCELVQARASRAFGRTEACTVADVVAAGHLRSEWRRKDHGPA